MFPDTLVMAKHDPAELSYTFAIPSGTQAKYIDLAQCLSAVNRRLYRQGKCYYIQSVEASVAYSSSFQSGFIGISTLPDTWVTRNAWYKAFKLWTAMNKKVLKDNPSVQGKWADFKVMFDKLHADGGWTSAGPVLNYIPSDTGGTEVDQGEWYLSSFVQPQHNVDPATGAPEAADEYKVHMLGEDKTNAGTPDQPLISGGVIQAYQDTRAQVRSGSPEVPAAMSTSWMTLLTDDGSQEPELADVIEDQNDAPPYDVDEYPGGAGNFNTGVVKSITLVTTALMRSTDRGFKVPLGLLKVNSNIGNEGSPGFLLTLHLAPGDYKGVLTTEMRQ